MIIESGNDYLIQVKKNQPNLWKCIEKAVEGKPIDICHAIKWSKGRFEFRSTALYPVPPDIDKGWTGVQRVVMGVNAGVRKGRFYHRIHLYICSLATDKAVHIHDGRRAHWGIEVFHYIKDVVVGEDSNGVSHRNKAVTFSILNNIAISLYSMNGYPSLINAQTRFTNKIDELWMFFTSNKYVKK